MFRIGIDFDNTIACYDSAFVSVAALLGIPLRDTPSNKVEVKREIQSQAQGQLVWQRLQGQVYGTHMHLATPFPGIHEFISLAQMRGHEVFIVSHKSIYGHFDADRIPLRSQAKLWLNENKFFRSRRLGLQKSNIFFESTREEKIQRIIELKCTHFVDDLIDVFEEDIFPPNVQKFLFNPSKLKKNIPNTKTTNSWRQVAVDILGPWSENEVLQAVHEYFPDLEISKADLKMGRANSRVYKLSSIDAKSYLLKIYPDQQTDLRPRLETEFAAIQILSEISYPVGTAVACELNFGWGIYEWLDGTPVDNCDETFIQDSINFIQRLYTDSHHTAAFTQFGFASEACLSGVEISDQIETRINKLLIVSDPALTMFIDHDFAPVLEMALKNATSLRGNLFDEILHQRYQIASPSDFGAHNALRLSSGKVMFYDFEYFGWDDPVKLVSDFYWHPGMALSTKTRRFWRDSATAIFNADHDFSARLMAYLPLFGLRWCLIILNAFLKSEMSQLTDADPQQKMSHDHLCGQQLSKAKALLQEIKEHLHHGSKVQAS
jgi:hypothetical protein